MRIAFYAPLKPPDHPNASGDRTMARLLIAALERAGHEVRVASRLRSRDANGDARRQARLQRLGGTLAARFIRRCANGREPRPDLWFTYHLYYKAPDFIGPLVADALRIPYVVAEASLAGKRRDGAWRLGHAATVAALHRADAVIGLNTADRAGIESALASSSRWHAVKPFIVTSAFAATSSARRGARAEIAARFGLAESVPWLIAVAMMRPGDKLASYRTLAAALAGQLQRPWRLLIVGDGSARDEVIAAFALCRDRIAWLGTQTGEALRAALAAADLFVWPAINEAYGMALLEAQAAGLPVLAGAAGGVADIVADGITGRLTPALTPSGTAAAFAAALGELLAAPEHWRHWGEAAARRTASEHDIATASAQLDRILGGLVHETSP
jgi:glycosyltransferase involved in cell wall biosynthesis